MHEYSMEIMHLLGMVGRAALRCYSSGQRAENTKSKKGRGHFAGEKRDSKC